VEFSYDGGATFQGLGTYGPNPANPFAVNCTQGNPNQCTCEAMALIGDASRCNRNSIPLLESGVDRERSLQPGTYSSTGYGPPCTPADSGSYVPTSGSNGEIPGPAGSYSNTAGATGCVPADPGSYVPDPASTTETPCHVGTYSNVAGATGCSLADPGSYAAGPGATQETPCSAGQ